MLFLLLPIALIVLYAFNPSNVQSWPLDGLSTKWFSSAWHNEGCATRSGCRSAPGSWPPRSRWCSAPLAAFAVHRFRFFGREAVSFLLVLPIALPGIITGMALNSFFSFTGVRASR